ncbi:hypothetical protein BDB01DRAFT_852917 [Pilobolus umbonatus]|nr:hypothetical protein BDB01DRAFT_852917 [Pilobolus umbonatus]
MTDPSLLMPDPSLLSKSSPSQLQPFQFKRSRPIESMKRDNKSSNLSHVPCKFYKLGTCTAGANCTFSHSSDLSSESAVCKYFVKGNCKFGTKCALLHTMSPYQKVNNKRKEQERSFLNDPYTLSAPSVSLFRQLEDEVWRRPNDLIGLRSPEDPLLGTSFVKSSSYYEEGYDLNDAMLPSSLNDLFTPNELQARRMREQESYYYTNPLSESLPNWSTFSTREWRTPFLQEESTSAINIPKSNHVTRSDTMYVPSENTLSRMMSQQDDEVQFFMDDHLEPLESIDNKKEYFPALLSLPTST